MTSALINLKEIGEDGLQIHWNNQTGELTSYFEPILGLHQPYEANFSIHTRHDSTSAPTYQLSGTIRCKKPEQCSRCGVDFEYLINESFDEILIPSLPSPEFGTFKRANHFSDLHEEGSISVTEYPSSFDFDMGSYLRELVSLAETAYPVPPENEKGECSWCHISINNHDFGYQDPEFESPPESVFSVLKNYKSELK